MGDSKKKMNRRQFLHGAGGASLILPMLPSLLMKEALAACTPTGCSPRFIAIYSRHGALTQANWYPSGLPSTPTTVYPGHVINEGPLTSFTTAAGGALSPVLGTFLNPYLSKLNLLRGLDIRQYLGHNGGGMLGNFHNNINGSTTGLTPMATIDQIMAYSSKVYTDLAGITRSLVVNNAGGSAPGMSWQFSNGASRTGEVIEVPTVRNPQTLFDNVFGNYTPAPSPSATPSGSPTPTRTPLAQGTLVDAVYADYTRLRANRRLSAEDRSKLESHLNMIHELQLRVNANAPNPDPSAPPPVACTVPGRPTVGTSISPNQTLAAIESNYALMNDVIVAAIKCGLTRVASIFVAQPMQFPAEGAGSWHSNAHNCTDPTVQQALVDINRWILERVFTDLIAKLDVPESGGRTFLDNSLVFYGQESSVLHSNVSQPVLTAGSAAGYFRTGNYIDYRNRTGGALLRTESGEELTSGLLYNRWLVTALQSMGLTPTDYELPGIPGYGDTYQNSSVYFSGQRTNAYNQDLPNVNQILPRLRV